MEDIKDLVSQTATDLGEDATAFGAEFDTIMNLMSKSIKPSESMYNESDSQLDNQAGRENRKNQKLIAEVLPMIIPYIALSSMTAAIKHNCKTKEELKAEIKAELLEEVRTEINNETNAKVNTKVAKVANIMQEKLVKCTLENDKRDVCERKLNITFSGIKEQSNERKDPNVTANLLIATLTEKGCSIQREDLVSCYRIFPRNNNQQQQQQQPRNNPGPPMITARFASQKIRDTVLAYRANYNDPTSNIFMNEDMTFLQRKLFSHLRSKEDIIFKKSVGYKDGKMIFLLKKNATNKKWSKVDTVLNLEKVDPSLKVDLSLDSELTAFGLNDCIVHIDNE